jgi:hypothetical protein
MNERAPLLAAFDRLFERAAAKLHFEYSAAEKAEARAQFGRRLAPVLDALDALDAGGVPEAALLEMEAAIDALSPADIAGHLAAAPLARHVQRCLRALALRAAEQRVLEYVVSQADDRYGGN